MNKEAEKFLREFAASVGTNGPAWRKALSKAEAQGLPDVASFKLLGLVGKLTDNDLSRDDRFEIADILRNVFYAGHAELVVNPDHPQGSGQPKSTLNERAIIYQHVRELELSGMKLKGNLSEDNCAFAIVAERTGKSARTIERLYYQAKKLIE